MDCKYNFLLWDQEKNIICDSKQPLLPNNHSEVLKHSPWAYSINTATGFYCKTVNKKFEDNDDLLRSDFDGTNEVFTNVSVCPHNYYDKFMLVVLHDTKQTILIDSRGVFYELPLSYRKYCYNIPVYMDKKQGVYIVDHSIKIRYRSLEEQSLFEKQTQAISNSIFNKEFNKFVRNNAKNNTPYLYLTGGESKLGALLKNFISDGMRYEIVPNILCDDETINLRIPLTEENARRSDVQYLCSKYSNNYSIYNVPYTYVGGGFESLPKKLYYDSAFSLPESKEIIVFAIVNTLRSIFSSTSDYELYKKTLSKITRLLKKNKSNINNRFEEILLLHPNDLSYQDNYVKNRLDYINKLLTSNGKAELKITALGDSSEELYVTSNHFERRLYNDAYLISKQLYRTAINDFESNSLYQISLKGQKISRWKNEVSLYTLVKKEYPDAIYQYHADWLKLQSLDIFIPSINVAIEYQGEQHYRPVDFFGGLEGFEKTISRDSHKAQLCEKNNIHLILWKYDEILSLNNLKNKINAIL